MFKHLFDLRYERDEYEAVVFYFFYMIFAYFVAGVFNFLIDTFYFSFLTDTALVVLFYLVPFVFYTSIALSILLKKQLKDRNSIHLVFYTLVITFFAPAVFTIFLGFFLGLVSGFATVYLITFIPLFFLGGIPSAILTMKEDCSLKKEIEQMEQEKLEQARRVERQLLIERTRRIEQEELENIDNNE